MLCCHKDIQISIYSHRPEIHDAITKMPGSLSKTLFGIERRPASDFRLRDFDPFSRGR